MAVFWGRGAQGDLVSGRALHGGLRGFVCLFVLARMIDSATQDAAIQAQDAPGYARFSAVLIGPVG